MQWDVICFGEKNCCRDYWVILAAKWRWLVISMINYIRIMGNISWCHLPIEQMGSDPSMLQPASGQNVDGIRHRTGNITNPKMVISGTPTPTPKMELWQHHQQKKWEKYRKMITHCRHLSSNCSTQRVELHYSVAPFLSRSSPLPAVNSWGFPTMEVSQ